MKQGSELTAALSSCPRVAVEGVWYRSVDGGIFREFFIDKNPKRPLWGLGASKDGARFTLKEKDAGKPISTLYVAEDMVTALREGCNRCTTNVWRVIFENGNSGAWRMRKYGGRAQRGGRLAGRARLITATIMAWIQGSCKIGARSLGSLGHTNQHG